MKYIKYLKYLLRHKYYVMLECFKVGLYWHGIIHDMSKFLPSELIPYTNYFYGDVKRDITRGRHATGYYKPTDTGDKAQAAFDFAWLLHQKRNRHHWQWWCLSEDEGGTKTFQIEYPYNLEMICDWLGAGKAQGKVSPAYDKYQEVRKWYKRNGDKMQLHPETRKCIEIHIEWDGEDMLK